MQCRTFAVKHLLNAVHVAYHITYSIASTLQQEKQQDSHTGRAVGALVKGPGFFRLLVFIASSSRDRHTNLYLPAVLQGLK